MSTELKMEEFIRTIPNKISTILSTLEYNTSLLKTLGKLVQEQEKRLGKLEARVRETELSTMIIN